MSYNCSLPQNITTATTTDIVSNQFSKLNINKTLTGTVTITDTNGTTSKNIAAFAIGTTPATFHYDAIITLGTLRVVTTAADNITVTL